MYKYDAELVRVIDGDTVRLRVDVGFRMRFEDNFRLLGINAPEMGTEAGHVACRELMNSLIIGGKYRIETTKPDKYGRWLVQLWRGDGQTVNDWMLKNKLAVPFMVPHEQAKK